MGEEYRTYHWGVEPTPKQRRVPVTEAAEALGISEGAVRMRVKCGTLSSTREGGRLYVLLNTEPTTEQERPHGRTHDRTSELIATLREQLQAERQAHSEARRLLAAALERIPAIESPQETSKAAETADEPQGRGQPHSASEAGESQEGTQMDWWPVEKPAEATSPRSRAGGAHSEATGVRRPWWRRMFGS